MASVVVYPKEMSLLNFLSEKAKKSGGKRVRTGGGGGLFALSNGTVQPHYDRRYSVARV